MTEPTNNPNETVPLDARERAQKILWTFMQTIDGDRDYSCDKCELTTYLCPHLFERLQNLIALSYAPTTEARERAREIVEAWFSESPWAAAAYTERDVLINRIAAAISSTPSVGDAIACVERLRDKWADDATAKGRAFSDKATTAEQIIAALEALQPSPRKSHTTEDSSETISK